MQASLNNRLKLNIKHLRLNNIKNVCEIGLMYLSIRYHMQYNELKITRFRPNKVNEGTIMTIRTIAFAKI